MKQYIVDAFTDKVFEGNPAAVYIMEKWLSDDVMQKIISMIQAVLILCFIH